MTFWDNDAGSKIHLLDNPGQDVAPISAARQEDSLLESQMQLGTRPVKGASEPLSLEGVSQMVYILPERLLALVRPAFDLVLRRIRSLKRCAQA